MPQLNAEASVCDKPVVLPNKPLTQLQVEHYWASDRVALVACGMNLAGLVDHYQALAADLAHAGKRSAN